MNGRELKLGSDPAVAGQGVWSVSSFKRSGPRRLGACRTGHQEWDAGLPPSSNFGATGATGDRLSANIRQYPTKELCAVLAYGHRCPRSEDRGIPKLSHPFPWFPMVSHGFLKKYENRRQEPGVRVGIRDSGYAICDTGVQHAGFGLGERPRSCPRAASWDNSRSVRVQLRTGRNLHSFTQFSQSSTISNDVQRFWA